MARERKPRSEAHPAAGPPGEIVEVEVPDTMSMDTSEARRRMGIRNPEQPRLIPHLQPVLNMGDVGQLVGVPTSSRGIGGEWTAGTVARYSTGELRMYAGAGRAVIEAIVLVKDDTVPLTGGEFWRLQLRTTTAITPAGNESRVSIGAQAHPPVASVWGADSTTNIGSGVNEAEIGHAFLGPIFLSGLSIEVMPGQVFAAQYQTTGVAAAITMIWRESRATPPGD